MWNIGRRTYATQLRDRNTCKNLCLEEPTFASSGVIGKETNWLVVPEHQLSQLDPIFPAEAWQSRRYQQPQ